MPEILEIEMYRRGAEPIIGRRVEAVDAPDDWYLKDADATELRADLVGSEIIGIDRVGKLLLIETDRNTEAAAGGADGAGGVDSDGDGGGGSAGGTGGGRGPDRGAFGLRFGMTGRLVIDERPVIAALEYSSTRLDPAWNRFGLRFVGGGSLVMNDPRRLGGVELAPARSKLGPDAWTLDIEQFCLAKGRRMTAIKVLLLNQGRIAGLGNLLTDELLWRVGIHPGRPCDELTDDDQAALVSAISPMLDELYARGGSHVGDHVVAREAGARCPRDGGEMRHATIGGRSTWWCSRHQG